MQRKSSFIFKTSFKFKYIHSSCSQHGFALQEKSLFRPLSESYEINHSLLTKSSASSQRLSVLYKSSRVYSNGPQGGTVSLNIKGCFCLHIVTVNILLNLEIFDILNATCRYFLQYWFCPIYLWSIYITFPSVHWMVVIGREPELWPEVLNVLG